MEVLHLSSSDHSLIPYYNIARNCPLLLSSERAHVFALILIQPELLSQRKLPDLTHHYREGSGTDTYQGPQVDIFYHRKLPIIQAIVLCYGTRFSFRPTRHSI